MLALAGTATADEVNVVGPVRTAGQVELTGPNSRLEINVRDTSGGVGELGAAAAVTSITLTALDSSGNAIGGAAGTFAIDATQLAYMVAPAGALGTTTATGLLDATAGGGIDNYIINLGASAAENGIYAQAGIFAVRVTVATAMGSISTVFNVGTEATDAAGGDECLTPDSTGPTISSVFRATGTDNALFIQFNEALSLAGIGTTPAMQPQTDPTMVTQADFERITMGTTFGAITAALSDQTFLSNNTIIRFDIGAPDTELAANNTIRYAAAIAGLTDAVGNAPTGGTGTGTGITAPPTFTIVSTGWRSALTADGAGAFAVTFSNAVDNDGAPDLGDLLYYNRNAVAGMNDSILRNMVASGINFADVGGAPAIAVDPNDPNTVLVDVAGVVAPDVVGVDGRDAAGAQYTWQGDATIGNPPGDIFGSQITGMTTALPVQDRIVPTIVAFATGDTNGDGEVDTVYVVANEPLTTSSPFPQSGNPFLVEINANAAVTPFRQITAAGALPTGVMTGATFAAGTGDDIALSAAPSFFNFDFDADGQTVTDRLESNNSVCLPFNPRTINWQGTDMPTIAVGDAMQPAPGTGDVNTMRVTYTLPTGQPDLRDASGNRAAGFTAQNVNVDGSAPTVFGGNARFFDGGNIADGDATNTQLFFAQNNSPAIGGLGGITTADLGDNADDDRVQIFASENLGGGAIDGSNVRFGTAAGAIFRVGDADRVGTANNTITLQNRLGTAGLSPSSTLNITSAANIQDAAGRRLAVNNLPLVNCTSPYCPFTLGADGTTVFLSGVLVSTDTNPNDAEAIRIRMTQPIGVPSILANGSQFTVGGGGVVSAATVEGDTIVLNISTNDNVAITSNPVVTFQGAGRPEAELPQGTTTNKRVAAANSAGDARTLPSPVNDTEGVAIMTLRGNINQDAATPTPARAPRGSVVYAAVAVPRVSRLSATHNNVAFTTEETDSLEAMTNVLLGLRSHAYLHRSVAGVGLGNEQIYRNRKNAGTGISSREAINLALTTTSLNNVTFTGTGETTADRVSAGSARLCWDVYRSTNGTMASLYQDTLESSTAAGGFQIGGQPILSTAVIDNDNGEFEIHISAPTAAFERGGTTPYILSGLNRPVILFVQLPDGSRRVLSSLTTSAIDGRGPILFQPNNQRRDTTTGNPAVSTENVVFNLQNVGTTSAFNGWNLIPNGRNSGYATTTGNRPSPRPTGVAEANIITASSLSPSVGPVDQFVWFRDLAAPFGVWNIDDDAALPGGTAALDAGEFFSTLALDADCFSHFAFTMTNQGVRLGNDINALTGGQALGFFNNNNGRLGIFQFGAPLDAASIFGTAAPNLFPNSTTTLGWALVTNTEDTTFANFGAFFTANSPADYMIIFSNDGTNIRVFSADSATPSDTVPDIDNVGEIRDNTAMFIHYRTP